MKNKKDNNIVFYISIILTVIITVWSILFNEEFKTIADKTFSFLTHYLGWLYLLGMTLFVIFAVIIALSKWGKIKLGYTDATPEYSTGSWFAMLFTAGMGVGLVFWGVAEPISHYINPAQGIEPASVESADFAIKSSFMHWGIHPWSCYAIVGLSLAYFQFRKKKPALVSSTLEPLIKNEKRKKNVGYLVDSLAAFATVAGVVTSLGLGVMQISKGLNYLFGIPDELNIQVGIVAFVTIIFLCSALTGIDRGIKFLSNINLWIAFFLLLFIFLIGPKLEIVNSMVNGLGQYLGDFLKDSLKTEVYSDNSWIEGWRVFYWAWWIAWTPFVGAFIARISKGRTVKEFILGVVVVPCLLSLVWFAVFGTIGIHLGETGVLSTLELSKIAQNPESGLFIILPHYPFGTALSGLAIVLLFIFFVTSADSGTFVLAMFTSNGVLNPSNKKKLIWGIIEGMLAIGLLVGGGLKSLQTISIVAALPFMIIMFFIMYSLIKEFKNEK